MKRIAIVGAGAMGTLLGACLNRAGVRAVLVDVDRPHIDALNRNGAAVTGTVEFTVPVTALTPAELEGEYDLVFLLIKQTFDNASFPQLLPHLSPEGVVVTLQNGMPELAVAAERDAQADLWRRIFAPTREGKSSILQDVERGRPSEIHAICGLLCAKGREAGVPTPSADLTVRIVEEAEAGGAKPSMENVKRFLPLLG